MVGLCLPVANNINKDLEFTAEIAADFDNKRLPTLDFELWLEEDGELNHYFQKSMKTPFVIMKRSAMTQHQKVQILSNEVIRRLSNINHKRIPVREIEEIMEVFIREMKTSEYEKKEIREIVVCGMTGWQRKMKRREDEGQIYRSARSTLPQRCKKKLLEKTSWYKKRRRQEEEVEKDLRKKKRKDPGEINREEKRAAVQTRAKSVIFCPYTNHSDLAKELRKSEEKLQELTGYKLKLFKRAGIRLEDLLHK